MTPLDPAGFGRTPVAAHYYEARKLAGSANPIAVVLPTTKSVMSAALACQTRGEVELVGESSDPAIITPSQILTRTTQGLKPDCVIFTDQILSPANATVRLKADIGDYFISPVEIILCLKYQYDLVVWAGSDYSVLKAGQQTVETICSSVNIHLAAAYRLGSQWLVRDSQNLRKSDVRAHGARTRISLIRSLAMNAYRLDAVSKFDEAMWKIDQIERNWEDLCNAARATS